MLLLFLILHKAYSFVTTLEDNIKILCSELDDSIYKKGMTTEKRFAKMIILDISRSKASLKHNFEQNIYF